MNAIGLTVVRKDGRCDWFHLEAAESGVIVLSNDKMECRVQVDEQGRLLSVQAATLQFTRRQPAFASVVLAVGDAPEVICE